MIDGKSKADIQAAAREVRQNCACFKVRQASRQITKAYGETMRPLGLKATQFTMLTAAALSDGRVSLTDLAEKLGMDRSTFSRNLGPLEREGLVELCDGGFGRARAVRLTEAGWERYGEAVPRWRGAQDNLKAALGEEGWESFHEQMTTAAKYA